MARGFGPPRTITYNLGLIDFGDTTDVDMAVKGPKDADYGELIDVGVAVTEVFNEPTTPAYVRLGTATDPDAYAELNMGTAAATDYYNTRDDPDAIINSKIPGDVQVEVAMIAVTGTLPTGIGEVHITIDWYTGKP